MAQKTITQFIDDLDGTISDEVRTVRFTMPSSTDRMDAFEIDLTPENREKLVRALLPFHDAARPAPTRVPTVGKRAASSGGKRPGRSSDELQKIREWAAANGYEVANRGRIPNHVISAFEAAA